MVKLKIKKNKIPLSEAAKDAKVLRNINIDYMKKSVSKDPDEEIRDYFSRLQKLERDPDFENPIFPIELVDWMESLPDNHFPRDGRKRFAKWLGNAIYEHETEYLGLHVAFVNLDRYNNDVRYISDFINGADEAFLRTFPDSWDMWALSYNDMHHIAEEWHLSLQDGPRWAGEYTTNEVDLDFKNGFKMVKVPPEDLSIEGELMGHCVGGYCDGVSKGEIAIYSLRDRRNKPHATIEVVRGNPGFIEQIKGKGNGTPVEKYRPMIKQWVENSGFDFQGSADYLAILTHEEKMRLIESGEASPKLIYNMASGSDDPRFLEFMLQKIEEYVLGGDFFPDLDARALLSVISRNRFLQLDNSVKVLELNLMGLNALSHSVGYMFQAPVRDLGDLKPDGQTLSQAVWGKMKDELTNDLSDEKMHYLQAIVHYSNDSNIKKELVDSLLSKETINYLLDQGNGMRNPGDGVNRILQTYLSPTYTMDNYQNPDLPSIDEDTLRKVWEFAKSEQAKELDPQIIKRVVANASQAEALPKDMAEDFFSHAIANNNNHHVMGYLIANRATDNLTKKSILTYIFDNSRDKEGVYARHFSSMIARKHELYDNDFILWASERGFLNDYFKKQIESEHMKYYGRLPKQITKQEIDDMKHRWLTKRLSGEEFSSQVDNRTIASRKLDQLEEETKSYLSGKQKPSNVKEIKDYFNSKINDSDEEYMMFNDHPQATLNKILDEEEPAPWD
tara:strand:- start:9776 stop:11968 length:2193 start_codon:yes stop_codon:yes gene_type:complete